MLDVGPSSLNIKARAGLRRMTICAGGLHIGDAAVSLARLRHVIAAGAVTSLALHVRKPRHVRFLGAGAGCRAGRVTFETAGFELNPSRLKPIRSARVRAVDPLHVLGQVALAASCAGNISGR